MHNSKFINTLRKLSESELEQFDHFISSPFSNINKHIASFWKEVRESAPEFTSLSILKKKLHQSIYGSIGFSEQRLYDLISDANNLLEEFLSIVHIRKNPLLRKQLLLNELNSRGEESLFNKAYTRIDKSLNNGLIRNEDYFLSKYLIQSQADLSFIKTQRRTQNQSLEKKINSLDTFYLIVKLKSFCEMANRESIIKAKFQFQLLDELLNHINSNRDLFNEVPAIMIYYRVLMTFLEKENVEHYYLLIKLLEHNADLFPKEEARGLYNYAQNFCIKKVNLGDDSFLEELFELNELLLKTRLIYEGDYITQWDYKNIVTTSTRLKKFEWTYQFIHEYKNEIAPEFRNNAYAYNLANYYYENEEFGNALKMLQKVELNDVYYHLSNRSLLLKIYYAQEATNFIYAHFDSFKMYLHRNRVVTRAHFDAHNNLIKFTKRAYNLRSKPLYIKKTNQYKKDLKKLKARIYAATEVTNINWLLEQVNGLLEETKL